MSKLGSLVTAITCEWCGVTRELPPAQRYSPPRFCGRSCSAKWRTAQPQFKEALSRGGKTAGGVAFKRAWQNPEVREKMTRRMVESNPMSIPSVVEKAAEKKRGRPFPAPRGGNGRGMTVPQSVVSQSFPSLIVEFSVGVPALARMATRVRRYSLDLADPTTKRAVEIDGVSHRTKQGKERDSRKDAILAALGWSVLRVSNESVLTDWETAKARIESFLTSK